MAGYMTEAELERLIDARVQRRLATDRAYRFAENAEAQAAREAAITRAVECEIGVWDAAMASEEERPRPRTVSSPADAWGSFVGGQSPAEWLAFGGARDAEGIAETYLLDGPFPIVDPDERLRVAGLLAEQIERDTE